MLRPIQPERNPFLLSVCLQSQSQNKKPPIHSGASLETLLCDLCFSALISSLSIRPYPFTSLLPASHNARRPARPTTHPAPHSSSPKCLPHFRPRALPANRAKLRGAPCPLLRVPRSTPALSAPLRRKTSLTRPSSSSRSPAPVIRKRREPPPPLPPAGPRKSRGTSAPPPVSPAGQGST